LLSRRIARHEAPLHAGREPRAATAAQARSFHFFDDLLARCLFAQDALPNFVPADLAIGRKLPRALVRERLEADEILWILFHCLSARSANHLCRSRISSTFSGVRFS